MHCRVLPRLSVATARAQIAYNRGLVSMEERNRVFRVMKRLQLPFWHPVCCTQLLCKVRYFLV